MNRVAGLFAMTVLGAAIAAGCGGGDGNDSGVVSCTVSGGGAATGLMLCQEVPASQYQQLARMCVAPAGADAGVQIGAHVENGPCSRVNALGGCSLNNGGLTVTNWWYRINGLGTPDQVKMLCAGIGGTFVAP